MRRIAFCIALLFAVLSASGALALEVPANGGQWVVDAARLLPPAEKDKLGAELRRYAEASGNQIVILTVPSLEGESIAAYANKVARAWGVGKKDGNTGVLILVARAESRVRFEVGRGLEDRVTDVLSKRIQREITVPNFKAGRFGQGLSETVKALEAALAPADGLAGNQTLPAPLAAQKPAQKSPSGGFSWLTLGLLVLAVVLVFALFHRRGGGGGFGGPGDGFGGGDGRGSSFLVGMLLGLLSSRWRGGGGGFGGPGGGFGGGDGGFSGGGGDFGGGGGDSGFGGGDDNS